ncbi:high-affinity nitrate transporter-activating protein 2.1-like [Iris pallida]|uniref:High-affinity nitrate transporter n=1 Tax=Iris pallida TaxID=29817 RepID=A0AAX6HPR8_IRIPA|nr:high-affinity nitrate transporter-activating protein 2.1-like [Iris pallida]KAJ6843079.1 high-affinity nitrate transporter-activating protein 2.1-like [Iris pallida]
MGDLFSIPVLFFLLFLLVGTAAGEGVLLSTLPRTLIVTASPKQGQVLKAGEDHITVSWGLNKSLSASTDDAYKNVKVMLCYAPVSQTDRGWRKTNDDLKKDKTCQFEVTVQPYAKSNSSFEYKIKRDVPSATYFLRAYLLDSSDTKVAYGQTTDAHKSTNLFEIVGISGRSASLDVAAGCFSAFSVVSLLFFFVIEKRKAKKSLN